ncbi:MAG: hypothetical protein ACPL1Y_07390 [Thermoplasmata archaeon]
MQNVDRQRREELELLCKGFLLTYQYNRDVATAFCRGFLLKIESSC